MVTVVRFNVFAILGGNADNERRYVKLAVDINDIVVDERYGFAVATRYNILLSDVSFVRGICIAVQSHCIRDGIARKQLRRSRRAVARFPTAETHGERAYDGGCIRAVNGVYDSGLARARRGIERRARRVLHFYVQRSFCYSVNGSIARGQIDVVVFILERNRIIRVVPRCGNIIVARIAYGLSDARGIYREDYAERGQSVARFAVPINGRHYEFDCARTRTGYISRKRGGEICVVVRRPVVLARSVGVIFARAVQRDVYLALRYVELAAVDPARNIEVRRSYSADRYIEPVLGGSHAVIYRIARNGVTEIGVGREVAVGLVFIDHRFERGGGGSHARAGLAVLGAETVESVVCVDGFAAVENGRAVLNLGILHENV